MLILRTATPADCDAIAHFHALSWQTAYRGILDDDFLHHRVLANRLARWRARMLPATPTNLLIRLACEGDELLGFVCVQLDADPQWGALLDNLHVHPEAKGKGIGRALMASAFEWVRHHRPHSPVHLWAFEANHPARAFYEHLGGRAIERAIQSAPDGTDLVEIRYVWSEPLDPSRDPGS